MLFSQKMLLGIWGRHILCFEGVILRKKCTLYDGQPFDLIKHISN